MRVLGGVTLMDAGNQFGRNDEDHELVRMLENKGSNGTENAKPDPNLSCPACSSDGPPADGEGGGIPNHVVGSI